MKKILILTIIAIAVLSCSDNDGNGNSNNCDFASIVSTEQYENAPSDQLAINSLEINGDCLKINFSASGCDGNSWALKLIDSEHIFESFPPQRNLRLSFKNWEDCLAFITKELTFDISNLQVNGNKVQLNLTNSENLNILYEY